MFALTETPMPTPTMTVAPESVTPGFVGFAAIVIVLIAVILLIWDMNRRIRRVRYREEVRDELDAEEAAAREADEATTTDADLPIVRDGDDAAEDDPRRT
jgi:Na+-transporting methylmalonyl-CoA/oxaloacetate decarboxylase gamma subunit